RVEGAMRGPDEAKQCHRNPRHEGRCRVDARESFEKVALEHAARLGPLGFQYLICHWGSAFSGAHAKAPRACVQRPGHETTGRSARTLLRTCQDDAARANARRGLTPSPTLAMGMGSNG